MTRGLPDNSDEDLGGLREELKLQKDETPAADLHASTGSLHIIKARGCFQWLRLCPSPHRLHQAPTRWFISAVVLNVFPRPERWELMRFTHVCREIHFWGKEHAIRLREKSTSRSRLMSQTTQRHRSTAGWQNRWWMFTFTLALNISSISGSLSAGFYVVWLFYLTLFRHRGLCCLLSFVVCHCFGFHVNFKVAVAFKG